MPANNDQFSIVQAAGMGHKWTNVWFRPNGGAQPTAFGGSYVSAVTLTGVGTFNVTLTGFSPRAYLGGEFYVFDNAAPTLTDVRQTSLTITPSTKTIVIGLGIFTINNGANKNIAANANSVVKLGLLWKTYIGIDAAAP